MAKGKTIAIVFTVIAGLGVLMVACCAGTLFFGFRQADRTVSPHIDALFSAIASDTFADTYETFTTAEFQEVTSPEQYAAIGHTIATNLGRLESKSLRGFNMRQVNADSFVDVTYAGTFEKGTGTIKALLKKQGDDWKFMNFGVESPVLDSASPIGQDEAAEDSEQVDLP